MAFRPLKRDTLGHNLSPLTALNGRSGSTPGAEGSCGLCWPKRVCARMHDLPGPIATAGSRSTQGRTATIHRDPPTASCGYRRRMLGERLFLSNLSEGPAGTTTLAPPTSSACGRTDAHPCPICGSRDSAASSLYKVTRLSEPPPEMRPQAGTLSAPARTTPRPTRDLCITAPMPVPGCWSVAIRATPVHRAQPGARRLRECVRRAGPDDRTCPSLPLAGREVTATGTHPRR